MAYLIRRVFKVKPGTSGKAADVIFRIGEAYHQAGQRGEVRVYWSGGSVPGPANTVYMDWIDETIQSPSREGRPPVKGLADITPPLRDFVEDQWIEFYELYRASPR